MLVSVEAQVPNERGQTSKTQALDRNAGTGPQPALALAQGIRA